MLRAMTRVLVLLAVGCAGTPHPHHNHDRSVGMISGVARDSETGEPIAHADVRVRLEGSRAGRDTTSAATGNYSLVRLPPGHYSLTAEFAGQPIDIAHIPVRGDETTLVDLTFTPGQPAHVRVDFGGPESGNIAHYRPSHVAPRTGMCAMSMGWPANSAVRL
jgi:hypothetical protein